MQVRSSKDGVSGLFIVCTVDRLPSLTRSSRHHSLVAQTFTQNHRCKDLVLSDLINWMSLGSKQILKGVGVLEKEQAT